MKNFIEHCKNNDILNFYLVSPWLLVNPASGDFENLIVEFADVCYSIGYELVEKTRDDDICRLTVKKVIKPLEGEFYKKIENTIENEIRFLEELTNEYGYIDGFIFSYGKYYIFVFASGLNIIFTGQKNEEIKYINYPHLFDCPENEDFFTGDNYVEFFDA